MKVIITGHHGGIMPLPYSGIRKRLLLHAREWTKKGHDVYVIASYKHDNEDHLRSGVNVLYETSKKSQWLLVKKIISHFFKDPSLFVSVAKAYRKYEKRNALNLLYSPFAAVFLEEAIKKIQPDFVIAHVAYGKSLSVVETTNKTNTPLIMETYAEVQFRKEEESDENVAETFAPMYKHILESAKGVVPASAHCAKGPRKYVPEDKIEVVYSGINYGDYLPVIETPREEAKKKLGLEGKRIILSVGKLHWRKGQHYLANVTKPVMEAAGDDVCFVFIGKEGGLKKEIEERAGPLKKNLIFRQDIPEEEMPYYYRAADVFAFPSVSERECMGMALKEAMVCGTPVVAFDSGGVSEAVVHEETGYLVKDMDLEKLKEYLLLLLSDKEKRESMGEKAKVRARDMFSSEVTGKKYLAYLESLL